MEALSATYFVPHHQSPQQIIPDQRYREMRPWLEGKHTTVPALPTFRMSRRNHPEGRIIWLQRGAQTVMSVAAARTYAAAVELWQELFEARNHWNLHSNPARLGTAPDAVWVDHTRLNLAGLTAQDLHRLHAFVAPLLHALIREQLELGQSRGRACSDGFREKTVPTTASPTSEIHQ